MNCNWFAAKVSYDKALENGAQKKVTSHYVVDALNYTEAEARIIEEVTPFVSGDFAIKDLKHRNFIEVFESSADADDTWYEAKVEFITLDEKTAEEKRSAVLMLVQADSLQGAVNNLATGMQGTMADYEVVTLKKTKIEDIYKYKVREVKEDGDE